MYVLVADVNTENYRNVNFIPTGFTPNIHCHGYQLVGDIERHIFTSAEPFSLNFEATSHITGKRHSTTLYSSPTETHRINRDLIDTAEEV